MAPAPVPVRARRGRPTALLATALAVLAGVVLPAPAGAATGDHDRVRDMSWPLGVEVPIRDDYDDDRSGGTDECRDQGVDGRVHQAIDLMAPKMTPVHAAMGGTVTWLPETQPSYGWIIVVRGDDGLEYSYIHLNNDTPGTDDGRGDIDLAVVAGVRQGVRVERGQHIGWVGDSGSAESTGSHLHLDVEDPAQVDPALRCPHTQPRVNPYPSLRAALDRGDVPGSITPLGGGTPPPVPDGWAWADVDPAGVHADAITALSEAGVLDGCSATAFCPTAELRRRDMARFIALARGLPPGTRGFPDVPAGDPDGRWIAAVAEAGIAHGLPDGRYDPDGTVTRGQMARFLVNAYRLPPAFTVSSFRDVAPGGVFETDIAALVAAGVTSGCDDGTAFCGAETVTRGQIATFLTAAGRRG